MELNIHLFDWNALKSIRPDETLPNETIAFVLYEFLDTEKELILSKNHTYTLEELWMSEYYWLLCLIAERNLQTDAGAKQQLYQLIEQMNYEMEIDWKQIGMIQEMLPDSGGCSF